MLSEFNPSSRVQDYENNSVGILRVAEVYCVRALLAAVPAVRSLTGG